jgi:ELWxxDGT repeat protein
MLAAVPELLIDLGSPESGALSYYRLEYETVGDRLYFVADDGVHGEELWISDGTTEATRLVRDIHPDLEQERDYGVQQLTDVDGTLFFLAGDEFYRRALWTSDGTESGTVSLPVIGAQEGATPTLVNVGGILYFASSPYDDGELWRSDGTVAGTYQVKDLWPSSASNPTHLTNVNGTLYFLATGTGGVGLWKSDGTADGTVLVKSLPREVRGSTDKNYLTAFGDLLYFVADDGTSGRELWRSDGTESGTYQVSDVLPGSASSYPEKLTAVGDSLYFTAIGAGIGRELWRTDGTQSGTELVADLRPGHASSGFSLMAEFNGSLVFAASGSWQHNLWRTDGTPAGTVPLSEALMSLSDNGRNEVVISDSTLYFRADDGVHGAELWQTDGTPAGTHLLADILPGTNGSYPMLMAALGDALLFAAGDGVYGGSELWRSDGTESGTQLVLEINRTKPEGGYVRDFTDVDGQVFFVASVIGIGHELWLSDTTRQGTAVLKDIYPGEESSHPSFLTNVNGTLYFSADDGVHGAELWKSDGTAEGTILVKDVHVGGDSSPRNIVNVNGTLYFVANDGVHGFELWKSDGTAEGTILVSDLWDGAFNSDPTSLLNAGGVLYFAANDGATGRELWKTDGTAAGTVLVDDIHATGSANVSSLFYENDTLYFAADDGVHGSELWRSDGTAAGTYLLKDVTPGDLNSHSQFTNFTSVDDLIYFAVGLPYYSKELWKTDGTADGTELFLTEFDGPAVKFEGVLIFGRFGELWRSDGTLQGSWLLHEYPPPQEMVVANGSVYFLSREELWQTDGTVVGTIRLSQPIMKSSWETFSRQLTNAGGILFYSLRHPAYGTDPWIVPLVSKPAVLAKHIFYNNSYFDGYTPGASEIDDSAIATDKSPKQALDGFYSRNVTSYSRGINGLMFDVVGLHNDLTIGDFRFRKTIFIPNVHYWVDAPPPSHVELQRGGGVHGSDRVTLIWPDGAIRNTWLRVIVRGNDLVGGYNTSTGLADSEVLHYGNLVGDSFLNARGLAFDTSLADVSQVFGNLGRDASITDPYDFNRDGRVSTIDATIVFASIGHLHAPYFGVELPGLEFSLPLAIRLDCAQQGAMVVDVIREARQETESVARLADQVYGGMPLARDADTLACRDYAEELVESMFDLARGRRRIGYVWI